MSATSHHRNSRNSSSRSNVGPAVRQQGPPAVKALIALLSAIMLVVAGVGYFLIPKIDSPSIPLNAGSPDGAMDVLLVGNDSRTDAQGNPLTPEEIAMLHAGDEEADNTDTIMVIRIPNDGSSATAISIPRDTYIHDDDIGNTKINGVYSGHKAIEKERLLAEGEKEGPSLERKAKAAGQRGLINAISDLTGISVDHYAEVGLVGFVLLTDAVGGVEVCLNAPVNDEFSGANFPAGRQVLNGAQGLAFVRQRHGLPRGDLDRIVRQQAYMASLVSKILSTNMLQGGTLLKLQDAAKRSLTLDSNWDLSQLAVQMSNLTGGNVKFNTIPVTSIDGTGDNGESVVTVDPRQVHKFFDQLLGGNESLGSSTAATTTSAQPTATSTVTVLNASGTTGLATTVASVLKSAGYTVGDTGNAEVGTYSQSQVLAPQETNEEAAAIAQELGGLPVVADATLTNGTITVVLAADYAGPTSADDSSGSGAGVVGQEGTAMDKNSASPTIDAGGNGPRCIN